jgi:hypothetical protein
VQVRAGQISFADAYFPGGAASPAVNAFCEPIAFTTPYTYTGASGGHLLLTLRHTGNNVGASGSLDWLGSSGNGQAIGVSSYTQATGWYAQGNNGLIVLKLVFMPPGACTGDITGDGKVCQDDLGVLLAAYGTCEGDPGYNAAANLATSPSVLCSPGTQGIDQADLGVLLADYGCGGCP